VLLRSRLTGHLEQISLDLIATRWGPTVCPPTLSH